MVLADSSLTTSFMGQYGPYAFGVVAVVILVLLALFVTVKGLIPLMELILKIQKEQTSQTANLTVAASAHERTTQNLAAHSEHLALLANVIKNGSGTIHRSGN